MLYSGTDPESYITEYTLVYEDEFPARARTGFSIFKVILEAHASRDHTLVGPLWEGYHESRRCSRDTYPESYITEYTLVYEDESFKLFPPRSAAAQPPRVASTSSSLLLSSLELSDTKVYEP